MQYYPKRVESWIEARSYGIGGSDAGTILGLNPYRSAYNLWVSMAGLVEDERKYTTAMQWGHRLEDAIASYFADDSGATVVAARHLATEQRRSSTIATDGHTVSWTWDSVPAPQRATMPARGEPYDDGTLFRSTIRPWQFASVDRFALLDGELIGLECKNVGVRMRDKWQDGPPAYVVAQCDHYMAVTGLRRWAVAVLFGGNDPGWMIIERDEKRIKHLLQEEYAFNESLKAGEPPPADGSESSRKATELLNPVVVPDKTIALPDEALQWDTERQHHKEREKFHKRMASEAENRIRAAMGDAASGALPSGVVFKATDVPPTEVPAHTRKGYRKLTRKDTAQRKRDQQKDRAL